MSRFFGVIFTAAILFLLTVGFLGMVDALPNAPANPPVDSTDNAVIVTDGSNTAEVPVRVVAKDIKLDITILNPSTTDIDTLDAALLKGAVRYPTSGLVGEAGTVLLFGHSSYLPIVHNQNYKAFNGIQNLKTGEIISVYSGTTEYRYSVSGVRLANATEDVVDLPAAGQHLALVTCDSFATKSDRFIVTADLVGSNSIGN